MVNGPAEHPRGGEDSTFTTKYKEEQEMLNDLSAEQLYKAELHHLPQLSREQVDGLVIHSRAGDRAAQMALLSSCLSYALGKASYAFQTRTLAHDDMLDLVQVANLEMLEALPRALAKRDPAGYLRGIARRAILIYCIYDAPLIRKPM